MNYPSNFASVGSSLDIAILTGIVFTIPFWIGLGFLLLWCLGRAMLRRRR